MHYHLHYLCRVCWILLVDCTLKNDIQINTIKKIHLQHLGMNKVIYYKNVKLLFLKRLKLGVEGNKLHQMVKGWGINLNFVWEFIRYMMFCTKTYWTHIITINFVLNWYWFQISGNNHADFVHKILKQFYCGNNVLLFRNL